MSDILKLGGEIIRLAVADLRFKILDELVLKRPSGPRPCLPLKCPVPYKMDGQVSDVFPSRAPCAASSSSSSYCVNTKQECNDKFLGTKPIKCVQQTNTEGDCRDDGRLTRIAPEAGNIRAKGNSFDAWTGSAESKLFGTKSSRMVCKIAQDKGYAKKSSENKSAKEANTAMASSVAGFG